MDNHERDLYDLGLAADLEMMKRSPIDRRRILKMGAVGIGLLLAGGRSLATQSSAAPAQQGSQYSSYLPLIMKPATTPTTTPTSTATGATATPTSTAAGATATPTTCVDEIPQETAGPYPGDGSNGPNILQTSGIVRGDIRTSIGTGNTAQGVPCTVILTLVNSNANCAPLAGYAMYLWHCTRDGKYSLYSSGVTSEDYLRGVQAAASDGTITFTTIFPGCYSGRWPHMHFEIYPSLAKATASSNAIHTSQLALPKAACDAVYATSGYTGSASNLSQISLASDNVFGDGSSLQVATATGDTTNGYTVRLTVGVDV